MPHAKTRRKAGGNESGLPSLRPCASARGCFLSGGGWDGEVFAQRRRGAEVGDSDVVASFAIFAASREAKVEWNQRLKPVAMAKVGRRRRTDRVGGVAMARRICDVRMQMGGGQGGFRAKAVREFPVARLQFPDPCRATTALRLGSDGAG